MKIGDYVRTKKGILKIRDDRPFKDDKNKLNYLTYGDYTCVLKENIIKSSPNIIDLIQKDDFVNSRKVYQVGYNFQDDYVLKMSDSNYDDFIYPNEIKSIVTKEQFESMEYKVVE